jgi:hypothetical protein
MQKSNILLERRVIREQEEVGEGFLSRLFGGGKKEDEKDKDYSDEELDLPMKEMNKSNNPNYELHVNDEQVCFSISEFEKFRDFCIEKGIYDIFLDAADDSRPGIDDNVKFESDWRESFIDRDGVFCIKFNVFSKLHKISLSSLIKSAQDEHNLNDTKSKIYYGRIDAYNAMNYPLAVYDEELKKYVKSSWN